MIVRCLVCGLLTVLCTFLCAQDTTLVKRIAARVYLDSVVITATQEGLSVEDFITLVLDDESLYSAFHNLRSASYRFDTEMQFAHRKGHPIASYHAEHIQHWDGKCRWMDTIRVSSDGNFFKGKRQKDRYYTYALYDRLFLTHGKVCPNQSKPSMEDGGSSVSEKHVDGLKTLMFKPGQRAQIPLIGRKTEIFSEEMMDAYDFAILSDTIDGNPVYIFTANAKANTRYNETVYKNFMTTFLKKDFQIIARAYSLSQKTAAYAFDVSMAVELTLSADRYFPVKVSYNGTWDIPTRKQESGQFTIHFTDFAVR